ncbi:Os09g0400700 [Oryza sativa Japonica Group]|uniref:Os09g0400700 protein n=2 Tax=Oryza sativa TaxID=4530 RepID=A0A0P0XMP3_ORYSJ|nr:hypothetical protein OsI_31297 [Oryza sativa Indica Group]KAB8110411.1 hypothetical protein EE612_047642 [Oryza sativa]BAT07966.1 Os09g0400700 [Oryza sativa Japonica Group]
MAISRSAPMEERDQLQGARRSAVGDYLETRPAGGGRCPATTLRASRSLSPLRRAGGAIPVGE